MPQASYFNPIAICKLVQAGDSHAESALVKRFSQSVMFMLTQRTGDKLLAEDLHQDTFRIVLERLRSQKELTDPSKLSGFIHRTALNVCIDHARKNTRRKTHADSELCSYSADMRLTQLEKIIAQERIRIVRDVIAQLAVTRDSEVLHRFYVLEQDKSQICNYLELSPDKFDRVISRARKRFTDAIEQRMNALNISEI